MPKILALVLTMSMIYSHNLSHELRDITFESAKQALIDKVRGRGDLPYATVEKQLEILEQVSLFDLGRFLIERGGLNGYWTQYVISHPYKTLLTPLHPLEEYLLNRAPTCLATQQRFVHFKTQIQKHLKEGCSLASIPSGLMGDLLELDFSHLFSFTLHGIDLDHETISQARAYAEERGLSQHCRFSQRDAWDLKMNEQFDLIASNGLTIYEPDHKRVVDLYCQFYSALKPGGILVTSFLTPPPISGGKTEWKLDQVNPQDALLQKILFVDILAAKWQVFRCEETVKAQLKEAGFSNIEIFYDNAHIFPTIIANK